MIALFAPLTEGDLKRIAAVTLIIIANFFAAVIGAIVKGGFNPANGGLDFKKLPEFFYKQVLPYVFGLAFFEAYLHVYPLSESAAALFGKTATLDTTTPSSFGWIDPAALWTVYSAMVANLVVQLSKNLFYLVGKGLEVAQLQAKT